MSSNLLEKVRKKCRLQSEFKRCILCEFVCTAFFMFTGLAVNAQTLLSKKTMNDYTALSIGWGVSMVLSAQLGYRISGSHMNPAVSFFLCIFGKITKVQFLVYSVAQTGGAFLGSFLVFILYYDSIYAYSSGSLAVVGPLATAGIFATYPKDHLSFIGSIVDQILATMTLVICVCAICDEKNKVPKFLQPIFLGLMLMLIQFSIGWNAANAMNPARDLGPRLMTWVVGYGWEVFSYRNYSWFWVPIVCPFIGAIVGSWVYVLTFEVNLSDDSEKTFTLPMHQKNQFILNHWPIHIDNHSHEDNLNSRIKL